LLTLTYLNPYNLMSIIKNWELVLSHSDSPCDVTIDWGDGSDKEHITNAKYLRHLYRYNQVAKYFEINMEGKCDSLEFRRSHFLFKVDGVIPWIKEEFWIQIFTGCSNLKSTGPDIFKENGDKKNLDWAFSECYNYTKINDKILHPFTQLETMRKTFHKTNIRTVPQLFLSHHKTIKKMDGCFMNCENLVSFNLKLFHLLSFLETVDNIFQGDFNLEACGYAFEKNKQLKSATYAFANCSKMKLPANFHSQLPVHCDFDMILYGVREADMMAGF